MTRFLVPVVVFGLALVTGCHDRTEATKAVPRDTAYTAPRNGDASRMSAKELAHHSAYTAAAGVATAGQPPATARGAKTIVRIERHENGDLRIEQPAVGVVPPVAPIPPIPPVPPIPPIPPVPPIGTYTAKKVDVKEPKVSFTVRSKKAYKNKSEAEWDALLLAKYELEYKLKRLDQPVTASPSLATIKAEYMKSSDVVPLTDDDMKSLTGPEKTIVDLRIELTEEQVTKLRVGQRVHGGLYLAGLLAAVLAAVYGFLRVDAWSKGYLTLWLAAAVAFVLAAALFLGFTR